MNDTQKLLQVMENFQCLADAVKLALDRHEAGVLDDKAMIELRIFHHGCNINVNEISQLPVTPQPEHIIRSLIHSFEAIATELHALAEKHTEAGNALTTEHFSQALQVFAEQAQSVDWIKQHITDLPPPNIRIVFETPTDGHTKDTSTWQWVGQTVIPTKRINIEDDGTYTAVADYWPEKK